MTNEISLLIEQLIELKIKDSNVIKCISNFNLLIQTLDELNNLIEMGDVKKSIIDQLLFLIIKQLSITPVTQSEPSTLNNIISNIPTTLPINNNNLNNRAFEGHMLHTVIYGPPGVGKTKVGCILAKIWISLGLLKGNTNDNVNIINKSSVFNILNRNPIFPIENQLNKIQSDPVKSLNILPIQNSKPIHLFPPPTKIPSLRKPQLIQTTQSTQNKKEIPKIQNVTKPLNNQNDDTYNKINSVIIDTLHEKITYMNKNLDEINASYQNLKLNYKFLNINIDSLDKYNKYIYDIDLIKSFNKLIGFDINKLNILLNDEPIEPIEQSETKDSYNSEDYNDNSKSGKIEGEGEGEGEEYIDQNNNSEGTENDSGTINNQENESYNSAEGSDSEESSIEEEIVIKYNIFKNNIITKTPLEPIYEESMETKIKKYRANIINDKNNVSIESMVKIVSRTDFVAEYLGHTALKTENLLKKNHGKVILIDEAYSLINGDKDSYGMEALTALNKYMSENPETVIIFLGYKDLMAELFDKQPGLKRRCTWIINIEKYTSVGITKIFIQQLSDDKWKIEDNIAIYEFFEKNLSYFTAYGGDTLRLIFYCKLAYSTYMFENVILKHNDIDSFDKTLLTKIINQEMLDEAFKRYIKNRVDDDDYEIPHGLYI